MTDAGDVIASALSLVVEHRQTLSRHDAGRLLDQVLAARLAATPSGDDAMRIAALFSALAARGETPEELGRLRRFTRGRAVPIPLDPQERALLVDTCGTGGDRRNTFNISTAAALVAAAAGGPERIQVAKHGNRAVTSRSGSADVLEALGIAVNLGPAQAAESLRRHGFAFLAAAEFHPAMKAVMPIRKALGVRTAFNLLGPMANPAGARAQVLGVYSEALVPVIANVLAALGLRHALVVSAGGMDEFSISGPTAVAEVREGRVAFFSVAPSSFGLREWPLDTLTGGDAQTNAQILRRLFANQPGPCRDVVVMNAAAVLVTAGLAPDFRLGAQLAAETIASGKVADLVHRLASANSDEGR